MKMTVEKEEKKHTYPLLIKILKESCQKKKKKRLKEKKKVCTHKI